MFKGSLAYCDIMYRLEFLHALHKYVSFHASHKKLEAADFISWLSDKKLGNRRTYPYLWTFLRVRKSVEDIGANLITFGERDLGDSSKAAYIPPTVMTLSDSIIGMYRRANVTSRTRKII